MIISSLLTALVLTSTAIEAQTQPIRRPIDQPIERPTSPATPTPIPSPTAPSQAQTGNYDTEATDISGQEGQITENYVFPFRRLTGITVTEHDDVPCEFSVFSGDTGPTYDEQCKGSSLMNETWEVSAGDRYTRIYGLAACFNKNSDRLKGLTLYHEGDGGYVQATTHVQRNCNGNRANWGERVDCPEGTHAYGLIAHYEARPSNRNNPIIGLQLVCRAQALSP